MHPMFDRMNQPIGSTSSMGLWGEDWLVFLAGEDKVVGKNEASN